MRPPLAGGLIILPSNPVGVPRDTIGPVLRPATAIVLVILLVLIAVAGVIQLISILSPSG